MTSKTMSRFVSAPKARASKSSRHPKGPRAEDPGEYEPNTRLLATSLRVVCADMVEAAKSGHPGLPLGMADVAAVLFSEYLNFNAEDPHWINRDRFVLSAGHGSALLYALLHMTGYKEMSLDQLKRFRQLGSLTPGHPEVHQTPGIETTTGPLGQGLANAVGMAMAERLAAARFGDIIDHHTYAVVGDGCLMEGISQEAITLAGHLKLSKLIVLFDDNGITIDGATDLSTSEDTIHRFQAAGWACHTIDGHDERSVREALSEALETAKEGCQPSLIACQTQIGKGAPTQEGSAKIHGSPMGMRERDAMAKALGWPHPPFKVPPEVYSAWERALRHKDQNLGQRACGHWQEKWRALSEKKRRAVEDFFRGTVSPGYETSLQNLISRFYNDRPAVATRQASQMVLDALVPEVPQLVGGSADLSGSNNTLAGGMTAVSPGSFQGNYVYYGIREHAMAAVMNGMALYGGFIPYGGTFLCFSDYLRPALRLSALMGVQVIYVFTHDSIGLGEDGPTHQPIEHLASLRAIPNLYVFRPCDAIETAEAWAVALEQKTSPSVLALSRQAIPMCRRDDIGGKGQNLTARGGYIIRSESTGLSGATTVVLIATGTEVSLAIQVAEAMEKEGVPTRVVSLPCWELFSQQPLDYKDNVLGRHVGDHGHPRFLRVSLEAASTFGWRSFVGDEGLTLGVDNFGASAPAADVHREFGLTVEAIVAKIQGVYHDIGR